MTRAAVQMSLDEFFGKAARISVVDRSLALVYLESLKRYISELEENFDSIDQWSIQDLERVKVYLLHNSQWLSGSEQGEAILDEAFLEIENHRKFLSHHGLLPEHLKCNHE